MALDEERHSKALEIELISDPDQKARQEAKNGLRQFDEVLELINYWLQPDRPFKLRISAILSLHRRALEGISSFAGVFRPGGIEIKGSKHTPPGAHLVPENICVRLGYVLPGTLTIPEQISRNKTPYYQALEAADTANASGKLDLAVMEQLLESLLANQLVSVLDSARTGK
jgi:hypothetical protein